VAGRREAKQKEALVSGGGVGWRMQWCEVGAGGGGLGGRHGVDRSGWRRWGREYGRHGFERAGDEGSGGQASGAGSIGWAGRTGTQG
jgi:hypothetical protein